MMLPQLHVRIEMMLQWYEGAEEHHSGGSALYKKSSALCWKFAIQHFDISQYSWGSCLCSGELK